MEKSFIPYLYSEHRVTDMLDSYCAPMLKEPYPLRQLKAKRLLKYWALLNDVTFFTVRIPKIFYELIKELEEYFPGLSYELSGRIKGLFSALNKLDEIEDEIIGNLKHEFIVKTFNLENENPDVVSDFIENKLKSLNSTRANKLKNEFDQFLRNYDFGPAHNPFNRVKDFFAFRIVLEDSYPEELIDVLYNVTDFLINFFNTQTFEVIKSDSTIQTGPLEVSSDLIYVPKESLLQHEHRTLVKDYVLSPKRDGYQSLHFVVFDPYTERYFEVQVRTRSMDIIAETLACHSVYKQKKYSKHQARTKSMIDYSKISVKGFRYFKYTEPGTGIEKEFISDLAGITKAIPIKLEFDNFMK